MSGREQTALPVCPAPTQPQTVTLLPQLASSSCSLVPEVLSLVLRLGAMSKAALSFEGRCGSCTEGLCALWWLSNVTTGPQEVIQAAKCSRGLLTQPPGHSRSGRRLLSPRASHLCFPCRRHLWTRVAMPFCTASLGSLGNNHSQALPRSFVLLCTGLAPCSVQPGGTHPWRVINT